MSMLWIFYDKTYATTRNVKPMLISIQKIHVAVGGSSFDHTDPVAHAGPMDTSVIAQHLHTRTERLPPPSSAALVSKLTLAGIVTTSSLVQIWTSSAASGQEPLKQTLNMKQVT